MKKGSISLSINMIVVVVLAFVMLGLMLTLGRTIVNNALSASVDISETTKQQIMDDLQRGDKPLSFPKNDIKVNLGDKELIAVGIKNTFAGSNFFRVGINAIKINGDEVPVNNRQEVSVDFRGNGPETIGEFQFSTVKAQQLSAGGTVIVPIFYLAKGTPKDTFSYELVVYSSPDGVEANEEVYASKSFFITVN